MAEKAPWEHQTAQTDSASGRSAVCRNFMLTGDYSKGNIRATKLLGRGYMELAGIIIAGVVALLGGGGLVAIFQYKRDGERGARQEDREIRQEDREIRAEFRATYEKDIELAKSMGQEGEVNRLTQEYLDLNSRWRAQQDLELLVPLEVQQTGPSVTDDVEARLVELLISVQELPVDAVSAQGHFLRGNAFYETSEYQLAKDEYSEAIRIQPNFPAAYNNRGNSKKNLKEYESAIDDFAETVRLQPELPIRYLNQGNIYIFLREFELALLNYDRAIHLNPRSEAAYNGRGTAKEGMGEIEDAIEDFSECIRLDSGSASAYNNRGATLGRSGRLELALADFSEAIRLSPGYSGALNNRGVTQHESGNFEEAIEDYNQAILFKPEDPDLYHNRGNAYQTLGNHTMAKNYFSTAAKLGLDITSVNEGKNYESGNEQ